MKSLSHVQLSATPWTAAHQAPPSMGFSRQEYWSGVPLPSPWKGQQIVLCSGLASGLLGSLSCALVPSSLPGSLFLALPSRIKNKRSLVGRPGPRDLSENMAATQGLSYMISDCKKLFQVSHSRPWCLLPRPSRTNIPDLCTLNQG